MSVCPAILEMNYLLIYQSLIKSRVTNPTSSSYYEKHHIIPKSHGGLNSPDNIVKLTAREHYLAHWLLTKIYPNCPKMLSAFSLMAGQLSPTSRRNFTASQYERCKLAHSKATKIRRANGFNPMNSPKARKKISDWMKVNNPSTKNPHKINTAQPVDVYFLDGTIKSYRYKLEASKDLNVPYWSIKNSSRKGIGIPKYNISKVIEVPKTKG
jgi:hypothetical protein